MSEKIFFCELLSNWIGENYINPLCVNCYKKCPKNKKENEKIKSELLLLHESFCGYEKRNPFIFKNPNSYIETMPAYTEAVKKDYCFIDESTDFSELSEKISELVNKKYKRVQVRKHKKKRINKKYAKKYGYTIIETKKPSSGFGILHNVVS